MRVEKLSPCKVNLLLNILGRRPDGFHELETVMQPVPLHDRIVVSREVNGNGIELACNDRRLPTDGRNLVFRAADAFLKCAQPGCGVRIRLEKNIPMAAGLGGGSGNAATTLLALNELFEGALGADVLNGLAAALGSDVPFFLQRQPALATGRGERVEPLPSFAALRGTWIVLVHPGFGISTPWAYAQLQHFPEVLHGTPGRARRLISLLDAGDLTVAGGEFYNSLEAPALKKFPLLELFQRFFREHGMPTLMSGSGSSTFAIAGDESGARRVADAFRQRFGDGIWIAVTAL